MTVKIIAKALVVGPDGRVLVLRREPNDANHPGRVDLPGGSVEPGEVYSAAIVREIQEESGLIIAEQDASLVYTFTVEADEGLKVLIRLLYRVHVAATDVQLSSEHDAFWWRTPEELKRDFAGTSWEVPIAFALQHELLS